MNYLEYFLYIFTVIIMIATPGPVMILVASAGAKGGYRKALQTILGTNVASLCLIALSILALKGVLHFNEHIFNIIKVLGCLYIGYLGFEILRETFQHNQTASSKIKPIDGGFSKGFLVGISNPKDIIFFTAFFPQFIQITPNIDLSLTLLIITWILLDFIVLSLVYLGFNAISQQRIYSKILALCGAILMTIAGYGIFSTALFYESL